MGEGEGVGLGLGLGLGLGSFGGGGGVKSVTMWVRLCAGGRRENETCLFALSLRPTCSIITLW